MYCKNCGQPVADNAKFCANCGAEQVMEQPVTSQPVVSQPVYSQPTGYQPAPANGNNLLGGDLNSTILFVFAIIFFVTHVIMELIAFYNPYDTIWIVVYWLMVIISNLSLLLIPLAIKKTPLKIISFVLIGLVVLYSSFFHVKNIIQLL